MVKNCDVVLENAALGLRPRAVFSRPRSQFFTIRTSQPANNIYIYGQLFDTCLSASSLRDKVVFDLISGLVNNGIFAEWEGSLQ